MMHIIVAFGLFIGIPFALIAATAIWEKLTHDDDTDRPTR